MGAVKALTADGLFIGQSKEFFDVLDELAKAADAARPWGSRPLAWCRGAGCIT